MAMNEYSTFARAPKRCFSVIPRKLIGVVVKSLTLCRDEVSVFYSPSWPDWRIIENRLRWVTNSFYVFIQPICPSSFIDHMYFIKTGFGIKWYTIKNQPTNVLYLRVIYLRQFSIILQSRMWQKVSFFLCRV